MWRCLACTLENGAAQTACEACGSAQPGTWACSRCTLQNSGTATECAVCGELRPSRGGGGGGPRRSKTGETWVSASHLLGQPAPRPKAFAGGARGCRPQPQAQRPHRRGQFVEGACRLLLESATGGWSRVQRIDLPCSQEPACPICLDEPVVPRLSQCGHAFCLLCAMHHLELSRTCPVCTAGICLGDLKPVRFDLVTPPAVGSPWRFDLVKRKGAWMGTGPLPHGRALPSLALEGDAGWRFARRVLAHPEENLARLHAECRELEAIRDDPRAVGALARLREQLIPAEAKVEAMSLLDVEDAEEGSSRSDAIVFYQSSDGQLLFLEPWLTKRLLATYQTWGSLPAHVVVRLQGLRDETVTDELRKRHRFLDHLAAGEVSFADGIILEPFEEGQEERASVAAETTEVTRTSAVQDDQSQAGVDNGWEGWADGHWGSSGWTSEHWKSDSWHGRRHWYGADWGHDGRTGRDKNTRTGNRNATVRHSGRAHGGQAGKAGAQGKDQRQDTSREAGGAVSHVEVCPVDNVTDSTGCAATSCIEAGSEQPS